MKYKGLIIALVMVMVLAIASSSYAQDPAKKLGRGLANILTGWIELPKNIYDVSVEENPLAKQILVIKNHAEARVRLLEGKSDRIIRMAETLNNLARRK